MTTLGGSSREGKNGIRNGVGQRKAVNESIGNGRIAVFG